MTNISLKQLKRAVVVREKIERLQTQFAELLHNPGPVAARRGFSAGKYSNGRRRMPASARAKLSLIAKKRWKKAKAAGKSRL